VGVYGNMTRGWRDGGDYDNVVCVCGYEQNKEICRQIGNLTVTLESYFQKICS
jgi:hypothetical protein